MTSLTYAWRGHDEQGNIRQGTGTIEVQSVDNSALARYLPAPGKVRPGFYVSGNGITTAQQWALEGARGSVVKPDIRAYYDCGSGSIPSSSHKTMAQAGHPVHCPVALRNPSGTAAIPARGLPAPARAVGSVGVWTYAQVLSGALDEYWTWLANQFKAVNGLIVFSLNIEPEGQSATSGRKESFSNPRWYDDRATLGNTAVKAILKEYADAYRYVMAKFESLGVTNVVYSMNYAALGYVGTWHNQNVYPAMWPGDDMIDMLGWDPYVNTPASQSWLSKLSSTLNYLRNGGLDSSFYPSSRVRSMPWHLPEFGCTPTSDSAAINWINQIPAALASVPELRALAWFSSDGTEMTTIHTLPAVRAAYTEMCSNPVFQPSRGSV